MCFLRKQVNTEDFIFCYLSTCPPYRAVGALSLIKHTARNNGNYYSTVPLAMLICRLIDFSLVHLFQSRTVFYAPIDNWASTLQYRADRFPQANTP